MKVHKNYNNKGISLVVNMKVIEEECYKNLEVDKLPNEKLPNVHIHQNISPL